MKNYYVLDATESLLHQVAGQPNQIRTEEETAELIQNIAKEKEKILDYLRTTIFNLKQKEGTREMVQKHHRAVILLINKTFSLQKKSKDLSVSIIEILEYLLISLEEVQQFLEISYPDYLDQQKLVGLPELEFFKLEIEGKLPLLADVLKTGGNTEKAIAIVVEAFQLFVGRVNQQQSITVKDCDYHKVLFRDLLTRGHEPIVLKDCPTLHELLLFWNFNSPESIKYFRNGLEELINQNAGQDAKLEFMRLQFKRLLHIPVMPKRIYDKNFPSIRSYFLGWLKDEIEYLEKNSERTNRMADVESVGKEKLDPIKVLLDLTADQIGLILRGADETRVLKARSLSVVYETIVPHLSTPFKEHPSWKNMRARTYNPERREVALSIAALEKIINVIKTY